MAKQLTALILSNIQYTIEKKSRKKYTSVSKMSNNKICVAEIFYLYFYIFEIYIFFWRAPYQI